MALVLDSRSRAAGWFVKKNPGFQTADIVDPARDLKIGAAMRKADRDLKETVDRALHHLQPAKLPAILASYGLTVAQATPTPVPLSPELRAARSTYLTQCSQCHGADARGTQAAANLRAFKGTDADFVRIVQNGRPGTAMVPWKGLISEEESRDIAQYIKSLPAEANQP
jgi:mono/diheme cytochrome c family protein